MRFNVLAVVGVLVVGAAVSAHETWMLPSMFTARVGQEVRLDVTSGMSFPELASPVRVDRVARAGYRLGEDQAEMTGLKEQDKSLLLTQAFREDGVATVWLELKPKEIDLTDDKVAEYFEEIGATEAVRATWSNQKGRVAWKETYTKHAKTFVAVGDVGADQSWQAGVGMKLEIVPVSDPLSVRVGGAFTVKLLLDGEPLVKMPVGLMAKGSKDRHFVTTDDAGQATFPILRAGESMVFGVYLRLGQDDTRWLSDFTTLTFTVR